MMASVARGRGLEAFGGDEHDVERRVGLGHDGAYAVVSVKKVRVAA